MLISFRYDLLDWTRESVSHLIRLTYDRVMFYYKRKDYLNWEQNIEVSSSTFGQLDDLLGTDLRFMIGPKIAAARALGKHSRF